MSPGYDLTLFKSLQEEYRDKPVVKVSHIVGTHDEDALMAQAERRLVKLDERIGVRGLRVLEVGCGRGHTTRVLAQRFGCDVVGVDIREYETWQGFRSDNHDLRVHDISADDNRLLGKFDRILSFAVWEHVLHPYAALSGVQELLAVGGLAHIVANLYRGPRASHRYREIFFPWPHLLFEDAVVTQYYEREHGRTGVTSAWVNKLTVAHYHEYFRRLGLAVSDESIDGRALDRPFYERFHAKLGRYPIFDLESDFLAVDLEHEHEQGGRGRSASLHATSANGSRAEVERLQGELDRMSGSTSWRVTAPVRLVGDRLPGLRRRWRRVAGK